MVFWLIISGIAFVVGGSGVLIKLNNPSRENRDKLSRFLEQDNYEYLILDIRKKESYLKRHIPGAIQIEPGEASGCFPTEDMFINIFIYGKSAFSANRAVRYLNRNGYFQVSSLGAFRSWKGISESGENENESK